MKIKNGLIKQERGAVATLVVFTIFMFIVILSGIYFGITTKEKSQLKSDLRIRDIYGKDVERINQIYNEQISNMMGETTIKIQGTLGENDWYTSDVLLKIEDPKEIVKRITYILSGAINKEETEIATSETITISAQGRTTVTIRLYDEHNNKSEKIIEIKKDSIEPTIELAKDLKVNINTQIDKKYIYDNATISDDLTTVSINNIKATTSENKEATLNLDEYDIYTISYDLKDEAGNIKQVSQEITTKPLSSKTLTNVLENAGFELELANYYNGTAYRSSAIKRTGNYSMYYTCNNSQAFLRKIYGDVGIQNNKVYIRLYTKTDSETLNPGIYIFEKETTEDWGNTSGRLLIWASDNRNYVYNSWNRISKVTAPTEKNYRYLLFQISQANSSGVGNVYWDDFMALVLDSNTWEKTPSTAWLDKMIPDFTGTQTFSW